jgi:hypothetical protein
MRAVLIFGLVLVVVCGLWIMFATEEQQSHLVPAWVGGIVPGAGIVLTTFGVSAKSP